MFEGTVLAGEGQGQQKPTAMWALLLVSAARLLRNFSIASGATCSS